MSNNNNYYYNNYTPLFSEFNKFFPQTGLSSVLCYDSKSGLLFGKNNLYENEYFNNKLYNPIYKNSLGIKLDVSSIDISSREIIDAYFPGNVEHSKLNSAIGIMKHLFKYEFGVELNDKNTQGFIKLIIADGGTINPYPHIRGALAQVRRNWISYEIEANENLKHENPPKTDATFVLNIKNIGTYINNKLKNNIGIDENHYFGVRFSNDTFEENSALASMFYSVVDHNRNKNKNMISVDYMFGLNYVRMGNNKDVWGFMKLNLPIYNRLGKLSILSHISGSPNNIKEKGDKFSKNIIDISFRQHMDEYNVDIIAGINTNLENINNPKKIECIYVGTEAKINNFMASAYIKYDKNGPSVGFGISTDY